ncbi:hypothetical protein L914_21614, partial [Phytophthora nicotianae]
MFSSSDEEEEGAINEPLEVTNDFDRQQQLFQAARRKPGGSESTPVDQGASINPGGYWPPEESFGADLFLAELKAPRGLIGDHTSKGAYERALVQKEQLFTYNVVRASHAAPDPSEELHDLSSQQPLGSLPGAVQSSPMSSRSGHNPSTSQGASAYNAAAAPGVRAPHGSGPLRSGQGGAEVPSYEYEYQVPPGSHSRPSAPPAGPTQGPEAGNQGGLARLAGRLDQLLREVSDLDERVDRRAFSSDLDEAFRMTRRVEGLQSRRQPHAYGLYPAYSAYSGYPL